MTQKMYIFKNMKKVELFEIIESRVNHKHFDKLFLNMQILLFNVLVSPKWNYIFFFELIECLSIYTIDTTDLIKMLLLNIYE